MANFRECVGVLIIISLITSTVSKVTDRTNFWVVDPKYDILRTKLPPILLMPSVVRNLINVSNSTRGELMQIHNELNNVNIANTDPITSVLGKKALDLLWTSIARLQDVERAAKEQELYLSLPAFHQVDEVWINFVHRMVQSLGKTTGELGNVIFTMRFREQRDTQSLSDNAQSLIKLQTDIIHPFLLRIYNPNISPVKTPGPQYTDDQACICRQFAMTRLNYRSLLTLYHDFTEQLIDSFDASVSENPSRFGFPYRSLNDFMHCITDFGLWLESGVSQVCLNPDFNTVSIFFTNWLVETQRKRTNLFTCTEAMQDAVSILDDFGISTSDKEELESLFDGPTTPVQRTFLEVVNNTDQSVTKMKQFLVNALAPHDV